MLVCGVELVGNDAIICLVKMEDDIFHLPECRVRRISCENPDMKSDLEYFQKTFLKLVEDYKIDRIVIKERMKKGKFSGGANGFKLEAAIQLMGDVKVTLQSPSNQKASLKHYPLPFKFEETTLKKFQETAFMAGFSYLGGKYEW